MARRDSMNDWYGLAKKRIGPGWKRMRKMDRDDWLASIGLERRNVTADIAGAVGFAVFGVAVGFGLGMLFAPRQGVQTREKIAHKVRKYTKSDEGQRGLGDQGENINATPPSWQS